MKLSLFIVFAGFACSVYGHSWLACSDYAEKNGANWSPSKCRGFPRDSARYAPKFRFGIDTGIQSLLRNSNDNYLLFFM